MTIRKVPTLPTWLLNRFVSGNRKEALLGDLIEEYQTGRTAGWYWRETLMVLVVSLRRQAGALFSFRATQALLACTAQVLLFVWVITLSEQYRQHCAALPSLLGSPIGPALCAGVALIAIALAVWLSPLRRHIRINARSGLVRLSVTAFAAIGLSGGALTWASTASCPMSPTFCSSSAGVDSCVHRGAEGPHRHTTIAHAAHSP